MLWQVVLSDYRRVRRRETEPGLVMAYQAIG